MRTFEGSVDVAASADVAYGLWLEWVAEPGAEITGQRPHEFIAWRAPAAPLRIGTAFFRPLDGGTTRLDVRVVVEPHGIYEEALAASDLTTPGTDLAGFKDFADHHHAATPPDTRHRTPPAPTRMPGIGRAMGKP